MSEAKIRAILDTAVNAIIVIDEQGSMQLFNPGAQKMFQYRGGGDDEECEAAYAGTLPFRS